MWVTGGCGVGEKRQSRGAACRPCGQPAPLATHPPGGRAAASARAVAAQGGSLGWPRRGREGGVRGIDWVGVGVGGRAQLLPPRPCRRCRRGGGAWGHRAAAPGPRVARAGDEEIGEAPAAAPPRPWGVGVVGCGVQAGKWGRKNLPLQRRPPAFPAAGRRAPAGCVRAPNETGCGAARRRCRGGSAGPGLGRPPQAPPRRAGPRAGRAVPGRAGAGRCSPFPPPAAVSLPPQLLCIRRGASGRRRSICGRAGDVTPAVGGGGWPREGPSPPPRRPASNDSVPPRSRAHPEQGCKVSCTLAVSFMYT